MALVDRFQDRSACPARVQLPRQRRMVVLQGQHIAGFRRDDLFGHGLLAADGVDADRCAAQVHLLRQVRQSGDFVGLAGHFVLGWHLSGLGGEGAH